MSKLQEALKKLSEDGGVGGDAKRELHDRSATAGGASEVSPDNDKHSHAYRFQSATIDRALLARQGLIRNSEMAAEIAQQFQRIKRPILNLAFGPAGKDVPNSNVIMFASALPGSGKSFCSFNLAMSISKERDFSNILIDADVLKPNISNAFGLADRPGLIDYLLDTSVSLEDIIVQTDWFDILVIPSGQHHEESTELLASKRMNEFVQEVSANFHSHAVLVDAPPLLVANEAQVLAERVGQIVLVVEAGIDTQDSVIQATETLNRDKPVNIILNKARGTNAGQYGQGYRESYPAAVNMHDSG